MPEAKQDARFWSFWKMTSKCVKHFFTFWKILYLADAEVQSNFKLYILSVCTLHENQTNDVDAVPRNTVQQCHERKHFKRKTASYLPPLSSLCSYWVPKASIRKCFGWLCCRQNNGRLWCLQIGLNGSGTGGHDRVKQLPHSDSSTFITCNDLIWWCVSAPDTQNI